MNVEDKDPDLDFRQAVTGIKRLTHNRMVSGGRKRRPIPRQSLADETSVLQESLSELPLDVDVESGEQLQYCQAGVKKTVYRRLKRGDFVVQGILDLHGLTIAQAKEKVVTYLKHCRLHKKQCIRIIHGKGLRSPGNRLRIKDSINHWLRQRDEVLAFCSARHYDGGHGALYVLLKK